MTKRVFRHAEAATLARFFRRTGQSFTDADLNPHETLDDLDDKAREADGKEVAQILEGMVDRSTHRWLDARWEEFKGRFPIYIAIFMIMACVGVILYMTRMRS